MTMKKKSGILDCAVCHVPAGTPEFSGFSGQWYVFCPKCDDTQYGESRIEAVKNWNNEQEFITKLNREKEIDEWAKRISS